MPQPNDLSRSLVALDQNSTIIAVVELSQSSWLVGGMLPGIERQPCKKLEPNPERLLVLLHRWRDEAVKAGRIITRIALAFASQLDWLSSTTAMIVLFWSRATRDLLKSFGWGIAALHRLDAATKLPPPCTSCGRLVGLS